MATELQVFVLVRLTVNTPLVRASLLQIGHTRDVVLGTRTRVQLEYKFEVLVLVSRVLVLVLVASVLVLVLVLVAEVLVLVLVLASEVLVLVLVLEVTVLETSLGRTGICNFVSMLMQAYKQLSDDLKTYLAR